MDNIYQEAVDEVINGARFRIDFINRSLKIGKHYIIKDGEYDGELGLSKPDNPLEEIERLFNRYHHSMPSERSENKRKTYFRALPEHELSEEDMLFGEPREVAQIKLELCILILILNDTLVWDEFAKGKWFWQSPKHKELIILKEWITGKNDKV